METAKRLNGVGEYYFSKKLREIDVLNQTGAPVINLGIGSPDQPPHPDVIAALQEQSVLPNVHGYQSYKGIPLLREAISNWYKRYYGVDLNPGNEVLPLIGSKEGIMHVCMTYFEEGSAVLVPNPGYPTYSSALTLSGATPLYYELTEACDYFPDFDRLSELIARSPQKVKGMFVNYPHMPTGQPPTDHLFERLVQFAKKHGLLLIHDNPYSFILNERPMSLLTVEGAKDCVIELNSLSKSHNMAGWRIGMLCAGPQFVTEVLTFKSNMDSGMFLPVQMAAARALQLGPEWFAQLNGVYEARRKRVYDLLDATGCTYSTRQCGLFVWAKVSAAFRDGYECSDHMLETNRIFITPGGIFGSAGNEYVRLSLCATEEKIIDALKRIHA